MQLELQVHHKRETGIAFCLTKNMHLYQEFVPQKKREQNKIDLCESIQNILTLSQIPQSGKI